MTPPPPFPLDVPGGIERRRTIRIRRSALLDAKLERLDRPGIKIAETLDEYTQAFRVLHDEYHASGYLKHPNPAGLSFGLHHLLPKTCVFVFKSYLTVLSTISYIPDSDMFGLPMDELYKPEIDALRDAGRKVVEIGSLATQRHRRWQNLMMFLAKAVFRYAMATGADDLCIMVNPKHVRFYGSIFLFQPFGEERHYQKVDAPAVALRVDMHSIEPSLLQAYGSTDFDTDLHSFFVKVNASSIEKDYERMTAEKNAPLESEIARALLAAKPDIISSLPDRERIHLERMYHKALYGGGRPGS
ncbi:MAG: N-acyl amino acid synthase FeeM domain-containing protein [Thermodesulfobacteriota bacterium]